MKLNRTDYAIRFPQLKTKRRIALLTDLHNGAEAAEAAAEMLVPDPPDVICIVGDLYESPPRNPFADRGAVLLLDRLPRGIPILYCRGNHDHTPSDGIRAALSRARATELDSATAEIGGILFGGLRSALNSGGTPDLAFLARFEAMPAACRVLLSHHPEYYARYIRKHEGIHLTLSGHAHGGQWCLFGRGIYAPGQGVLPKYTHGIYDGGRLAVSRGLHNPLRIPRIACPTELVYLSLGP